MQVYGADYWLLTTNETAGERNICCNVNRRARPIGPVTDVSMYDWCDFSRVTFPKAVRNKFNIYKYVSTFSNITLDNFRSE